MSNCTAKVRFHSVEIKIGELERQEPHRISVRERLIGEVFGGEPISETERYEEALREQEAMKHEDERSEIEATRRVSEWFRSFRREPK